MTAAEWLERMRLSDQEVEDCDGSVGGERVAEAQLRKVIEVLVSDEWYDDCEMEVGVYVCLLANELGIPHE